MYKLNGKIVTERMEWATSTLELIKLMSDAQFMYQKGILVKDTPLAWLAINNDVNAKMFEAGEAITKIERITAAIETDRQFKRLK